MDSARSQKIGNDLVLTRELDAPRDRVWKAWTQAEHVAHWWGPEGFRTRVEELDLRPGGRTRYVMIGPDGCEYPATGVFREIVPGTRTVASDEFGDDFERAGVELPQGTTVTADFSDAGAGRTRLRLRIAHLDAEECRKHEGMGVVEGWHSSFDCLESYLERLSEAGSRDEAEIRGLTAAWARALEAKDPEALVEGCAPDVLVYDLKPPFRLRGVDAYRQLWRACLPHFPDPIRSEHRDLEVSVDGDLAFAHGLHRIVPIGEHSCAGETWVRVTTCYRRIGGHWRVVHEHVSVPHDPTTGRVAPITRPEEGA